MKYQGTIEGKEKQLGNLRKLLTQNQDKYFDYGFNNFVGIMTELYDLHYNSDVELSKIDSKVSDYLVDMFKNEDDLFDKIYLIIPDELKILNKLFADDELEYLFDKSLRHLYDQIIYEHTLYKGLYDLFEKMLTELFKSKLKTEDEKIKLIRNFLFKSTINGTNHEFILRSKGNTDLIKQIFENEISDDLIDGLLTDFYIYWDKDNYLDNEKYPLTSSGNKVKLKDINFDLTVENGFYNLDFILSVSKIGIIKFQLNFLPTYSLKRRKIKEEETQKEDNKMKKLLEVKAVYGVDYGDPEKTIDSRIIEDSSEERENIVNEYVVPPYGEAENKHEFISGKTDMLVIILYGVDDGEPTSLELNIKTFEQAKAEIEKDFEQKLNKLDSLFQN